MKKIKTWVCDNIHFVHMDYHNINFIPIICSYN